MLCKNSQKNKGFTLLNPIKREFRKKRNYLTGFTLIELLIVVAIIGMLSAVVLTSTKGAKTSGADTAVKTGLQQIIAQAENYYAKETDDKAADTYGSASDCYDGIFTNDSVILKQVAEVKKQSSGGANITCYADDQSIAVSARLKSGKEWCVDNDSYKNYGTAQNGTCSEDSNSLPSVNK